MDKRHKVKKGDQVKVLAGEHKGKEGTVKEVIKAKDRVVIEGVNMITRHVKPSATNPQGGVIEREAGIHISNVMVIDNQGNATRVGRRRADNGKLVRYSKKSNEEIK
ncbi:MAG: 50S ribosomal protein L24 [Flavobacteriales bacterium]|jgi:large subunit ribosomal protein L24|uniref:50S ribosomal protein L24 n=1 Tax=Sanyastnella coralliicola TaxID=3069118 RepID=UPI0027B89635|nr:50S ribosomal protein L24 [Longitalea sp. SCSIO 12813]MCH2197680.1 50S ribosomal protein L24 [Flavobacteriales bacterium]